MKILIVVAVLGIIAVGVVLAYRRIGSQQARDRMYADLKAVPPVAKDFTTPEGAILCLEDAYRREDIEAAIAAKDFKTEARLMLQKTGPKTQRRGTKKHEACGSCQETRLNSRALASWRLGVLPARRKLSGRRERLGGETQRRKDAKARDEKA